MKLTLDLIRDFLEDFQGTVCYGSAGEAPAQRGEAMTPQMGQQFSGAAAFHRSGNVPESYYCS